MSDRDAKPARAWVVRARRTDRDAEARWEDEGGSPSGALPVAPLQASGRSDSGVLSTAELASVDVRQDELMTIASSDGRPPTHGQRLRDWRWFGIGAAALTAGTAVAIFIAGVGFGAVLAGLAFGVLLLGAASPVWASGLMRGREERAAEKLARAEHGNSSKQ